MKKKWSRLWDKDKRKQTQEERERKGKGEKGNEVKKKVGTS